MAGFAGRLAWAFDLAAHFRVQYALILSALAAATALGRRVVVAGAALLLAVVNLAVISPPWDEDERPTGGTPELTILVLNLDARNDDHAAVAELIRTRRPDVFGALELTPKWAAALEEPLSDFGSRRLEVRDGAYGVGLWSRLPLADDDVVFPAGPEYPLLVATVAGRDKSIRLALLHPKVPATPGEADDHETLIDAAGAAVAAASSGAVIGDLNTTPWSARYRSLLDDADLEDTRAGYGLAATWPAFLPSVLRIPIDHVLVTPDLAATERKVGPDVGSDHLPVWVELSRGATE